jgi:hypothetical protein
MRSLMGGNCTVWMRTRLLSILLAWRESSIFSVDEEQLDRCFKGSFTANVQMPGDEGRLDDWQLYVEGRERSHLGKEIVGLCCVGRGTA